jgi:hypothetical protein
MSHRLKRQWRVVVPALALSAALATTTACQIQDPSVVPAGSGGSPAPAGTPATEPVPATPTAAAARGPASDKTDIEVEGFAHERGIAVADARRRLGWQVHAPDLAQGLEREPYFAGVWIDVKDGDRVKVGVAGPVTASARTRIVGAARAAGLTEGYDVVGVRHPQRALDEASEWLGREIARVNAGADATLAAGQRTDLNALELEAPPQDQLTPAQRDLVARARARLGDLLTVSPSAGPVVPHACAYPFCDAPLRGGILVTHPVSSTRTRFCTGGFIARSKSNGVLYQFTAGHCVWDSLGGTWSTRLSNGSSQVIGPAHSFMPVIFGLATGDAAILQIKDPVGWNPQARVNVTAGADPPADQLYNIASDNYSVTGMRICVSGAVFGRSNCGFVTQRGVTVSYAGLGVTVANLGRASFCSVNGDSGAPVWADHVAYGILVAGSLTNQCDSYYQGIRAAASTLNVNVLHTS